VTRGIADGVWKELPTVSGKNCRRCLGWT